APVFRLCGLLLAPVFPPGRSELKVIATQSFVVGPVRRGNLRSGFGIHFGVERPLLAQPQEFQDQPPDGKDDGGTQHGGPRQSPPQRARGDGEEATQGRPPDRRLRGLTRHRLTGGQGGEGGALRLDRQGGRRDRRGRRVGEVSWERGRGDPRRQGTRGG